MPWIIATTLTVFVPLLVLYWYVGRGLADAITRYFGVDRKKVGKYIWGIGAYANAFPVLFLIIFLWRGQSRIPAFAGESVLVDLFFAYPFWFGLVITVQMALVLLVMDLGRLVLWPLYRPRRETWKKKSSAVILAFAVFIAVYSVATIINDTWTVRIVEREFRLPAEAERLEGITLVHISDVQGDGRTTRSRLESYVQQINDLQPDILLFSGDLVSSGEAYIASTAEILSNIRAPFGKIAVVGDHDIFSDKDSVVSSLRKGGFVIEDDTTVSISVNGEAISVTLLTHTYRQRPDNEDLKKAVNGADGVLRILLVHQPAEHLVDFASSQGYHIFLAGHTHGGGVAFGIPGVFLFSPALTESRFVSGFYYVSSMLVSVTNGIGMTLAPIRFHAPAEITVIRLVR
ncbi:MAG: metallophosphoesterase [Ignavibacteriales bacterium]|nr:metallophosphoesterase [Ignavibacteriales bacterium]